MSDKIPFYPNFPIANTDPVGSKSEEKKALQDSLVVAYANALSGSLASNYLSEFGSNNRLLYEGVSKILSNLLLDCLDLVNEVDYSQIRPEFFNDRLYSLLFPKSVDRPTFNNETELKQTILNLIQALLQGSKGSAILELLNKIQPNTLVEITEIGDFLIDCLISSYTITTEVNDHKHYVYAPILGLGKTSAPIGYKWGDDIHQHDVLDGIVQTANEHTHEVLFGFQQDVITLQDNLYKLLLKTKPAHVNIGNRPSSLFKEIFPAPAFDFSLTAGLMFQEDLRKTDQGIYLSSVYGYTTANSKFLRFYDSGFKINDRVRINNQERKIISASTVLADDIPEVIYSVPRLDLIGVGQILNHCLIVPPPGGFVLTTYEMQEGELVLIGSSAYFILKVNPYTYKLSAQVFTLDRPLTSTTAGLYLVEDTQSSFKTRPLRYKKYTQTFEYLTSQFTLPFSTPYTIHGMPILPSDFTCSTPILEYNTYTRVVSLTTSVNEIEITYPYDETDQVCFNALNDTSFVLNSYRPINQRPNTNLLPTNRIEKRNGQVLFHHRNKYPLVKEWVRSFYAHSDTNTLNNTSLVLNSKTKLNRYNVINAVHRILAPSTASVSVLDGKIILPFVVKRIISVKQGMTNITSFKVNGNAITFTGIADGIVIDVVCLTNRTVSQTGDWFRPEQLNEGMIPFKNIVKQVAFDVDEFMANPLGNATTIEKPRQTKIKETITDNSGVASEFSFFKDEWIGLEQTYVYEEVCPIFRTSGVNNAPFLLNSGILNLTQYVLNNNTQVIYDGNASVEILLIEL
jgi:hypothetical protein